MTQMTHEAIDGFRINLNDRGVHYVFDSFLDILLQLLAYRDHYTYQHSLRVAALSCRIGERLGLAEDEILALEHGGLIHDIGKLSIPDDVLLKPGRFSPVDRCIMNSHSLIGARLFENRGIDERIVEIILRHHERLDGSGYPEGLGATGLSIFPRIVAAADVYEALTARRPYKPDRSSAEALDLLWLDVRDGKLDGVVVEALATEVRDWNPLTVQGHSPVEDLVRLEDFRQTCYFREPLSQFYSYRYLFSFDQNRQTPLSAAPYALFALCFKHLKRHNQQRGYLEMDEILCAIGERLQERIAARVDLSPRQQEPPLLFLKKGADYIIYNRFDRQRCRLLRRLVADCINEADVRWGLECECRHRHFDAGEPFALALDLLFAAEVNSDCTRPDTT